MRWHAGRDALRHISVALRTLRTGRRASRSAFPREHGNDENLEISIVPMLRVIRGCAGSVQRPASSS
ncbi:DUF1534 domain-containing protein [Pseudomonas syringae USA011]|nr:DUF1534 domain-containing protein [Pseudomonas syringae USA011]